MEIFDFIRWDIIWNYRELYAKGLLVTIGLTACGYIGGVIFGLFLGLGQVSSKKWLYWPAKIYVDVFRGTPMLVQLLLIHLAVIPTIFGQGLGWWVSGIVG